MFNLICLHFFYQIKNRTFATACFCQYYENDSSINPIIYTKQKDKKNDIE